MLRRAIGDDAFRTWAGRFYRDFKGRKASFADVRRSLEGVSKQDLGAFFADWVERPGAPTLAVSVDEVAKGDQGFVTTGTVRQTQAGAPFHLAVPVVLQTTGAPAETTVALGGAGGALQRDVARRSRWRSSSIPSFDLFRRLDPRETPPSIGQIFGEPRVLAVVPASAPPAAAAAYRALVESWRAPSHVPEIRTDAEVTSLPTDRPVWILGRDNRLAAAIVDGASVTLTGNRVEIDGNAVDLANHTTVVVRRHPGNVDKAIGWIAADPVAALPGLGRKLPHYGKYSYLAFEGTEPTNTVKGEWTQSDSPLRARPPPGGRADRRPRPPLARGARAPGGAAGGLLGDRARVARQDARVGGVRGPRHRHGRPRSGSRVRRRAVQGRRPRAGRRRRHLLPALRGAANARRHGRDPSRTSSARFRAAIRNGRTRRRSSRPTTTISGAGGPTRGAAMRAGCIPAPTTTRAASPSCSSSHACSRRRNARAAPSCSSPSAAKRRSSPAPGTTPPTRVTPLDRDRGRHQHRQRRPPVRRARST